MEANFKIGDVVRLNSGGPKMTIENVIKGDDFIKYSCYFFEGTKILRGPDYQFDERMLVAVPIEELM